MDGAVAILCGLFCTFLLLWLLGGNFKQMRGDYFSYLKEVFGEKGTEFCEIFYFFYSISIAGFAAYTICHLILKNLLQQESFEVILLLLLLLEHMGFMEGLKAAEESMRSYTGRWRSCC